jgi:regulator of RNase E activity RraA
MPPSLREIIERYKKLDSALIYDTMDAMGLCNQQLSLEIKPLDINWVLAGPAFTRKSTISEATNRVKTDRLQYHGTPDGQHEAMYEGCIVVEDVGNDPICGGLGENAGLTAQMHGCAGVVSDGGTRDRKALLKMGFPVFSKFSSCMISWGRRRSVDYQIPVRISGHQRTWVTVNPGDFIFGDCDGILVIPQALTLEVLEASEQVARNEEEERQLILAGKDRRDAMAKRFAHVRRVVPRELEDLV